MKIETSFHGHSVEIKYNAGAHPYLWIGDNGTAIATIEGKADLERLRDICNTVLARAKESDNGDLR